jgi:hypothetical protein
VTAKKRKGPLRREADYAALASLPEVRKVLKAVCKRLDRLENNLEAAGRLHTTQDVADIITCQEFMRNS